MYPLFLYSLHSSNVSIGVIDVALFEKSVTIVLVALNISITTIILFDNL